MTTPGDITDGMARFGVKIGATENGSGAVAPAGSYGTTNYFMHYVSNDQGGVTGVSGDPIYTTEGAPLTGGEAELVFGANRGPTTPAGNYSARFSLLATGKF